MNIENCNDIFLEKMKYSTDYAIDFDENTIYLCSELDYSLGIYLHIRYNLLKMWHKEHNNSSIKEITLHISSYGGEIYAINSALDFIHDLKNNGVLINTKAQGVCMSAATILLAAGTGVRSSYPNTTFLLHGLQIDAIEGTAHQIKKTAQTIDDEQFQFFSYYAKFANKNKKLGDKELKLETKKWIRKYAQESLDHYLDSNTVLNLGLIDKII